MKVCFVAAPLMARSGVYRTTYDLVNEGRRQGFEWSALVGLRPGASGESPVGDFGVEEFTVEAHGREVLREIGVAVESCEAVRRADVIVTLITQSDIALSRSRARYADKTWVAYVRGLPWPDRGEQTAFRRLAMRAIEERALRKADEVWATTPLLAGQIESARRSVIIPAGVPSTPRISSGDDRRGGPLVWAGRLDDDKRPEFFLDLLSETRLPGVVYGTGPLETDLRRRFPDVRFGGWAPSARLWQDASIFVGTSRREAFGRSAVEAAHAGVPVVISDQYGAAEFLFTDPELSSLCVLPVDDLPRWADAVTRISTDDSLARAVSDHVYENATKLSIGASASTIQNRLAGMRRG